MLVLPQSKKKIYISIAHSFPIIFDINYANVNRSIGALLFALCKCGALCAAASNLHKPRTTLFALHFVVPVDG